MSQPGRLSGQGKFCRADGQVIDGEYFVRVGAGSPPGGRFLPAEPRRGADLFNQRGVLVMADRRECACWFSDDRGTIHLQESFLPAGSGSALKHKVRPSLSRVPSWNSRDSAAR